jgi:inorganic pyrophosphatase
VNATVDVVGEVPSGSRNKYEAGPEGVVRFDRRLPDAFAFPADDGHLPGDVGSDGDPWMRQC